MGELATSLFQNLWYGLLSLPVFDLGFSFGSMLLGIGVVILSIRIFKMWFPLGGVVGTNIGKNVRKQQIAKRKAGVKP